jgi:Fic-DOC domain mobile mystery protein B
VKDFKHPDGATPIDPNEASGLLLTHITTRDELNRWEQDNIVEAQMWLDRTKPKDILTEDFARKLHKRMFRNVWRWAGQFRQSDKNIGVHWRQVPMALRDLCRDAQLWLQLREETPDQIAVRFHHRLVFIHPFPNGNGRQARLMTDLLLENVLGSLRFSWGGQDLSRSGDVRNRYIAALRSADGLDYQPLLTFVRSGSKEDLPRS